MAVPAISAHHAAQLKLQSLSKTMDGRRKSIAPRSLLLESHDVDGSENACHVNNGKLLCLSKQGKLKEVRQLMRQMAAAEVPIMASSFRAMFEECQKRKSLLEVKVTHEMLKTIGEIGSAYSANWIMRLYNEINSLVDARKVFDEIINRNSVSWGTMILAYAQRGLVYESFGLFVDMLHSGEDLNPVVYTCLLRCLTNPSVSSIGKQVHSHIIRNGPCLDVILQSALLNMYVKCGCLDDARTVFHSMEEKNVASWTAMMVGYTQAEMETETLLLFAKMVNEGANIDEYVFSIVLRACARLGDLKHGKEIHSLIAKLGYQSSVSVGTPLLNFYANCSAFESASKAFKQIAEPNDVSWSALIAALCQNNEYEESVNVFGSLRRLGVHINAFTYTNIFQACSALADFTMGAQIHADALKRNLIAELHGENALVTMYSRCGRLNYANEVFHSMKNPDIIAWTAIILGHAYQGDANKALELFRRIEDAGMKMNSVTFIAVLTACSHAGLVMESKQYFELMSSKYGINPNLDHFNCLLDVYSRAGMLEEAFDLIQNMPFPPDARSWKSILSGCCTQKNLHLGELAAKNLLHLDRDDAAGYVLLFNLYSSVGKWKAAAATRKAMASKSLRKEVGCSWMNVKGKVHRFVVGDERHPQKSEIYSKLEEISNRFSAGRNSILSEDAPWRREQILVHSEKLAIAYGLLSTPKNTPIRIFKNLRACKDCHEFGKHVSALTRREIVIRDALRFHHFRDGECSCGDYW